MEAGGREGTETQRKGDRDLKREGIETQRKGAWTQRGKMETQGERAVEWVTWGEEKSRGPLGESHTVWWQTEVEAGNGVDRRARLLV
jgi:hypothetical protein